MLELGQANAAAADVVKDGTEATFMADVIEASAETPVIVDFWAEWCGPCKTLGPMLEDAVKAQGGKVRMVKIDVDKEQRLAQALAQQGLPIQSIPTVVGFVEGRPVDMFQGAVPQSQVTEFVRKLAEMAPAADGGLADAVAAAEEMLEQGALTDAIQTFGAILQEDPQNAPAYAGLVRAHIEAGDLDQAEAILNGAPVEISGAPELEAVHAQIELKKQAAGVGPVGELLAAVEADPDNHQARFDLAKAQQGAGDTEAAIETLLELFRRDREWNDEAAKTQLFTIFDALPAKDPAVLRGRRKLSSMIFA